MLTHELPDMIFLPDRAKLAINCLLGCLNSEKTAPVLLDRSHWFATTNGTHTVRLFGSYSSGH